MPRQIGPAAWEALGTYLEACRKSRIRRGGDRMAVESLARRLQFQTVPLTLVTFFAVCFQIDRGHARRSLEHYEELSKAAVETAVHTLEPQRIREMCSAAWISFIAELDREKQALPGRPSKKPSSAKPPNRSQLGRITNTE